jgi:DDE superfamily endonuclease
VGTLGDLSAFRRELHRCLTRRADALFELCDAVLCADGPVGSLVGLSLAPEHRRGHGALYDALSCGKVAMDRLRRAVDMVPLPRDSEGRIMLAVDVSAWLRPAAAISPDRCSATPTAAGRARPR